MSKLLKLLLALLLSGAFLVGCGGDDDDDADVGADVEADADVDADTDTDVDLDDVAAFGNEDCLAAAAAYGSALAGVGTIFSGADSDQLQEQLDQLEDIEGEVPDEIQADLEVVVEAYSEFLEAYADLDFDPQSGEAPDEETLAALQELGETFEDSDVQEASDNVNAWFEENCGTAG